MHKIFARLFLLIPIAICSITCTSTYSEKDNIYIRIENKIGKEITKLWLGNRIIKPNSYSSTSYQMVFEEVPNNQRSEYQQNVGKFWGYYRGNGSLIDSTRVFIRPQAMERAVNNSRIQLVNATITNPYNKKNLTRPTLPDGKYTLILGLNTINLRSTDLVVKLVKD